MWQFIGSLILGYLLGSFPTAYLLVKQKIQVDIRNAGSGNVGARNALNVSGSKLIGIAVMAVDILKGAIAVTCGGLISGNQFWVMGAGGFGAVMGHIFSPWLRFKGGRGLSTTAGVMLLLGWIYVVLWLIIYNILQRFVKNVNISSVVSSFLTSICLCALPEPLFSTPLLIELNKWDVFYLSVALGFVIFLGHLEPVKEILKSSMKKRV